MIRHSVARVVALTLLAATPVVVGAQSTAVKRDNTGYGTTAAEFLLIGANARGMALGGGYLPLATDLGALYANPGALALIKRAGVQGSQLNYIADTKLNWGGVATPYGGGSGVCGGVVPIHGGITIDLKRMAALRALPWAIATLAQNTHSAARPG